MSSFLRDEVEKKTVKETVRFSKKPAHADTGFHKRNHV
jgi:hypothetical protein